MFLKDFFYYSRKERYGIYLLLAILFIGITTRGIMDYRESGSVEDTALNDSAWRVKYMDFQRSIHWNLKEMDPQEYTSARTQKETELFPFDPNRVDSTDLIRLGLSSFAASNVLRYRAKGGTFKNAEAFARIYGLSENEWSRLRPYIHIDSSFLKFPEKEESRKDLFHSKSVKYKKGIQVNANRTDTTELKRVPGIGPALAKRFVKYRNQLGGFYHLDQLKEIPYFSDSLINWFTLGSEPVQSLPLNHWNREELLAHPYLTPSQVEVIIGFRKKHGALKSLKQLSLYEEFQADDLERLEPYVTFDYP